MIRKLRFLPNTDGFPFVGVTLSGSVPGVVRKGEDELFHACDLLGRSIYHDLIGWRTYDEQKKLWENAFSDQQTTKENG